MKGCGKGGGRRKGGEEARGLTLVSQVRPSHTCCPLRYLVRACVRACERTERGGHLTIRRERDTKSPGSLP